MSAVVQIELGVEMLVFLLLLHAWTDWRKYIYNTIKEFLTMNQARDLCECPGVSQNGHTPVNGGGDNYAAVEDALKSTFRVLKYVMGLMLCAFALSGLYFVEEGTVALHTRLGRIAGGSGQEIVVPGGPYFALPSPLDEIRIIPTTIQEVVLHNSFWFRESEADANLSLEKRVSIQSLAPEIHGSLLTGDKNIVHARWAASFRLSRQNASSDIQANALRFFHNVGSMERARIILAAALERAVIRVIGRTGVNDFYKGDIDTGAIRQLVQTEMDELQTGLAVTAVSLKERTVPLATLPEFQAAGQAESEKARQIEEAGQERARILNRAAGGGHDKLLTALDAYEHTRAGGDAKAVQIAEAAIDDLLLGDEAGGAVSSLIRSAMTSRTQTVEFVRSAAQRFEAMLALHNENPSLYRSRQLQDTIQRIFESDVQSFHLPQQDAKTLYLEVDGK